MVMEKLSKKNKCQCIKN